MHRPVLLKLAIDGLNVKQGGCYIDATFGEGGHAIEISKKGEKVLGIDIDYKQIQNLESRVQNLKIVRGNFKDIEEIAKKNNFISVDGILFDLGLSMRQIYESGRGFSYEKPEDPLDMRMNVDQELTASEIINSFTQDELYEILAKYSEELNSRSIARTIIGTRYVKKIHKVGDLLKIIDQVIGKKDKKVYARIFQGLRIVVNNELENLRKGLMGSLKILNKKGRIVVISFHSLEDRIVKKFIKDTRLKKISSSFTGRERFGFERSARLRVIGY